jgi:MATE family multidrug resistance protein
VFEIVTILSAKLSIPETASQSLAMTTYYPLISIPSGLSYAATAIIGSEIGSGRVEQAKKYAKIIRLIAITTGTIVGSLLFFGGDLIASIFTNNELLKSLHSGIVSNSILIVIVTDTI